MDAHTGVTLIGPNSVYTEKPLWGVGGDLQKLTRSETRIVGAAGHLLECETFLRDSTGVTSAPQQQEREQAVLILRAALALHALEEAQAHTEKAMKEKDGLVT